jgi:hypothetical protein
MAILIRIRSFMKNRQHKKRPPAKRNEKINGMIKEAICGSRFVTIESAAPMI